MQLKNLLRMKEKPYITLVNTYDLILLSGGNAQNATSEQLGQNWMDHTSDNSYFFIYREKWASTWHKKVWWKRNAKACEPTPAWTFLDPGSLSEDAAQVGAGQWVILLLSGLD